MDLRVARVGCFPVDDSACDVCKSYMQHRLPGDDSGWRDQRRSFPAPEEGKVFEAVRQRANRSIAFQAMILADGIAQLVTEALQIPRR